MNAETTGQLLASLPTLLTYSYIELEAMGAKVTNLF